jgi:hypothetical protein
VKIFKQKSVASILFVTLYFIYKKMFADLRMFNNLLKLESTYFRTAHVPLLRTTWWRLYEGGGSQKFGRAMHLKIRTNVSAGIHPRFHKSAR